MACKPAHAEHDCQQTTGKVVLAVTLMALLVNAPVVIVHGVPTVKLSWLDHPLMVYLNSWAPVGIEMVASQTCVLPCYTNGLHFPHHEFQVPLTYTVSLAPKPVYCDMSTLKVTL